MRVLILRAREDAQRTARALLARGHAPVIAPLLRIVGTDHIIGDVAYRAVLAASAHAVEWLNDDGFRRIAALPLFVVGERTANAARQRGFRDVRVAAGDGCRLAGLVVDSHLGAPDRTPLLLLAGRDRKAEPAATLLAAGYPVDVRVTYRAEAVRALPAAGRHAIASGTLDAVLHYSRRSADLFVSRTARAGLMTEATALRQVCLSEDVAAPLRMAGWPRIAVAIQPDEASLLTRLEAVTDEGEPFRD